MKSVLSQQIKKEIHNNQRCEIIGDSVSGETSSHSW